MVVLSKFLCYDLCDEKNQGENIMLAIISAIENDIERELITNIYKKYYRAMYERAYVVLHDKEQCEEVIQDTFIRLIEHVNELMTFDPTKVATYSFITARNLAINYLRKNKRDLSYTFTIDSDDEEGMDYWVSDTAALPEDLYIHEEELQCLSETLEKLPETDRTVLESKYILNMTDSEIAELLNISSSSVRCYLTRARRKAYAMMRE